MYLVRHYYLSISSMKESSPPYAQRLLGCSNPWYSLSLRGASPSVAVSASQRRRQRARDKGAEARRASPVAVHRPTHQLLKMRDATALQKQQERLLVERPIVEQARP